MQTLSKRLTYVEWLRSPQSERATEFVDGRAIEVNPPSGRHVLVNGRLKTFLDQYFAAQGLDLVSLFTVGVDTENDGKIRCRIPDLVVCTTKQALDLDGNDGVFKLGKPPAIVVEILSPSTEDSDTGDKRREYQSAAVPEYWIINPNDQWIEVMTQPSYAPQRTQHGSAIASAQLPGLQLDPARLFPHRQ